MKFYQHGDVLIKEINNVDGEKLKTNVVMEGEFTGHAHRITQGQFQLYKTAMQQMYLQCLTACVITHEEHKPIEIPKGTYIIEAVREFDPFEDEIRAVRD